ncbi:Abortive infection protein [Kangiella koreensis DSM 16069]|uniref:Abortive infection protein n=1 Tax=Kangiella koreensis (strain DSM 16069 / JCM 12317 / KCTC 12182 / SW-125) TaxID=523791 RepID=C7RAF4_KANKD|nr:Abortive infection protein [Kangiella koreensis DSM 16069]
MSELQTRGLCLTNLNQKYQQPFAESIILSCLALVMLAFTTSSILFVAYFVLDLPLGTDPPSTILSISVSLGLLISYALIIRLSRSFFSAIFVPQLKASLFWIVGSILIGVVFSIVVLWFAPLFKQPSEIDSTFEQILTGGATAKALLFISVVLLAPIGEEYLFRGVLLSGLSSRMRTISAILLSSVVFMAFHLLEYYGYWFALVAIFLLGILLAMLRLRSQSMLVPILCHASYNLIMLTLA